MQSQFKFSIDDDRPDTVFISKRETLKMDKLSQRLTISIILMLLLIGASGGLGYYYASKELTAIREDYHRSIQNITQDLDSKFSVLSKQFATLESTFANIQKTITKKDSPTDELLLELERTTVSLKDQLQKMDTLFQKQEKNIEELKQTKIGKQELDIAELTKTIDSIRTDANNSIAAVKILDQKFARELASIASKIDTVETEIDKGKVTKTVSIGIDKKTLDIALEVQQKKYQDKINELVQRIDQTEKDIQSLRTKLIELDRSLKQPASGIQIKPLP